MGRSTRNSVFLFLLLQLATLCNSFPLSTSSRWIVDDSTGKRVKLTCVNWASHLQPMIAEGLEKKPMDFIAKQIVSMGFNCVRFTWPTYMYTRPEYGGITVSESLDRFDLSDAKAGISKNNPQILNMKVVELHKMVVDTLGKNNIMVVLDNYVSLPNWCCAADDGNGFFWDANFGVTEWLQALATVASTYKTSPAVVGMSLRNELRGSLQNEADWYKYMQQGANTVHKQNPNVLVILSGLSYDTNLGFLKANPIQSNLDNKLVFEAHWYSYTTPATAIEWASKTNKLCAEATKQAKDNYLFLMNDANYLFPVFLSEFGVNNEGDNEADNRYITCLLATVAELDFDWALWSLQGSYILRQGTRNMDELYGVLDFDWNRPRNPAFLDRLKLPRQINQVFTSTNPTYYLMYHPQSGQCVQVGTNDIVLANCKLGSQWAQHKDNGPIQRVGSPAQCLSVAGDGAGVRVSDDCSSKWKTASSSDLHIAAQDGEGNYLCLERNASDSKIVTKKCLCVGEDLNDRSLPCADNPQVQWFKFVPANVRSNL